MRSGAVSGIPNIEASNQGDPISRLIAIALMLVGVLVVFNRRYELAPTFVRTGGSSLSFMFISLLRLCGQSLLEFPLRYIGLLRLLIRHSLWQAKRISIEQLNICFGDMPPYALFFPLTLSGPIGIVGYVIGVHGDHFMAGILSHKTILGSCARIRLSSLHYGALRRHGQPLIMSMACSSAINSYLLY